MSRQNIFLIGIDEAGRGAVIGPLSITSVAITPTQEKNLKEIVKYDSKKYTRKVREKLVDEIIDNGLITTYHNVLVQPSTINKLMARGTSLNLIEVDHMIIALKKCIEQLPPNNLYLKVIVDSMYTDPVRCKFTFIHKLHEASINPERIVIKCEHKADEKYVPVRIASIISKVIRDREIEQLHKIYGDFGSGYPSDPKTISFLREVAATLDNNKISSIVRIYWKTWKDRVD